jgi:hypothetical protein
MNIVRSPRYSPLIAAERKYHLATARPYNEAAVWEGIKAGPNLRGRL